jgi:hypothetical protein
MSAAMDWIASHRRPFLELSARRLLEFWFPNPAGVPAYAYTIWLITLLSLAGLAAMTRQRLPMTWFVGAVFLVYPVVYYFVQSSIRFRYPILWLSLLPAGYGLNRLFGGVRTARRRAL